MHPIEKPFPTKNWAPLSWRCLDSNPAKFEWHKKENKKARDTLVGTAGNDFKFYRVAKENFCDFEELPRQFKRIIIIQFIRGPK